MDITRALILGLVQGLTEFLPVSSSGHLVLFQHLFNLSTPLLFDILLHLGTLIAVLVFFWRDFWRLLRRPRVWGLVLVGSVPAGVVGGGLGVYGGAGGLGIEMIFSSLLVTGLGFLVTSGLLSILEVRGKRLEGRGERIDGLGFLAALKIGLFQALAILPGISRSGATIVGGTLVGLSREEAFTFSFLLSVPAILGAVAVEGLGGLGGIRGEYIWGVVLAAAVGYMALRALRGLVISGKLGIFAFYTFFWGWCALGSVARDWWLALKEQGSPRALCRGVTCNAPTRTFTSLLKEIEIPELGLETVFQKDHSWVNDLPKDKTVTLVATGDVGLGRTVNTRMIAQGVNYPFLKTADFLREADITLTNLESPLIDNCPPTDAGMIFCGGKENVGALTFAGVDVVNFATNHIGNYGEKGVEATRDLLEGRGISTFGEVLSLQSGSDPVAGVGALHVTPLRKIGAVAKEIKGASFVFLGWEVLGGGDEEEIKSKIKDQRSKMGERGYLVCNFHWGDEYTLYPNARQRELAHLAIDSGCDLIIGNHPHWVQGVEIYKDKFIAYSHGNFIFDQMWSRETREGVVGIYTTYGGKLVDVEFKPVLIEDYCQPHFLEGEEKEAVLERMQKASLR